MDQAVFTEGTSRIAAARTLLDQYRKSASLTNLDAVIDNIDGAPQMERLSRVKTTLEGLRRVLEELGDQAAAAINAAQAEIQAAQADWEAATSVEREGYGEVLRSLADEGLDPGKYIAAKKRLASIKTAAPRLDANAKVIRELLEARSGMLDELRAHETDATERLLEAIRSANMPRGGRCGGEALAGQGPLTRRRLD